jgi:enoyl-[acyl-carrier protein] reductase I
MDRLSGKVALVFGVANKNSIAWGITQALHDAGATVLLSYAGGVLEKRVKPLAASLGIDFVEVCDVSQPAQLDDVFDKVRERYGRLDILVHAVAYAPREDLGGRFVDVSPEGFRIAMDSSAYSLIAMARRAEPLMTEGGSIMALSFYAAVKYIPDYNVMSIAKAALESIVRYLAVDLGPNGIRVNAISSGPVKTLSAGGIPGFRRLMRQFNTVTPLRNSVSIEDIGQMALFLGSDMGRSVTGQTIYVDTGYSTLGFTATMEQLELYQSLLEAEENGDEV